MLPCRSWDVRNCYQNDWIAEKEFRKYIYHCMGKLKNDNFILLLIFNKKMLLLYINKNYIMSQNWLFFLTIMKFISHCSQGFFV